MTSKSRIAAANAATEAAKIAAGGALTTAESMLAGAIAGSATTLISNPFWVVNTRQTVRVNDDASLMNVLPFYPQSFGDWWANGLKQRVHWEFVGDFKLDGEAV